MRRLLRPARSEPLLSSSASSSAAAPTRARAAIAIAAIALLGIPGCDHGPTVESVRSLHREGRYEEALEPLRSLLEARPEDAEIHYLYGLSLVRSGDARVARWSLQRAAEDERWKLPATLELASIAAGTGDYAAAVEAAERVLAIEPDHLGAHIIRGEARLASGEAPEQALEDFDFVLEQRPGSVPARAARAAVLLQAGRVDEATAELDALESDAEASEIGPAARARVCTTRAVLDAERGEAEAAEARFDDCLERFPADPLLLDVAIRFFDGQGQQERATGLLEAAVDRQPRTPALRLRLAERAKSRGDLEAAESILRAATDVEDPTMRSAAWTALTNLHLERDDLPAAIAAYEEALALTPDPPPLAILTHADLLARANRHARALEVAADLENDAYRGLIEARFHLNEGRPAEALARLDAVLPTWPNNPGARYYAARAAERLGDFARAIEEYRQSIRSAPEQTEAALRLARLYLAAGSPANAWTSASQYYRAHPQDPEGVRLLVRAAATTSTADLKPLFARLRQTPLWSVAVAARAEAMAERAGGAEAALASIEELPQMDLREPQDAEVLRVRVSLLAELGRLEQARRAVDAARAAHPDEPAIHAIEGMLLEREGATPERIEAAYRRALAIDPEAARPLEALGRLAEARGEIEEAFAWYDRAWAAAPEQASPALRAAELAARSQRLDEAERRLEALLDETPWQAEAARQLARLRLDRGDEGERTLELAERAVLFRGGEAAARLLVEVHRSREEGARADEIAQAIEQGRPIPPRMKNPIDAG